MKIKELIKKLKNFDQNKKVFIFNGGIDGENKDVEDVAFLSFAGDLKNKDTGAAVIYFIE